MSGPAPGWYKDAAYKKRRLAQKVEEILDELYGWSAFIFGLGLFFSIAIVVIQLNS